MKKAAGRESGGLFSFGFAVFCYYSSTARWRSIMPFCRDGKEVAVDKKNQTDIIPPRKSFIASALQRTNNIIGDKVDVISANIVCLLFSGGLLWFALTYGNGMLLHILMISGISSAVLGWATGIAISPYNEDERSSFNQISKVVYGFISGYVVSKVDKQISKMFEITSLQELDEKFLVIAAFCSASFLLAVCTTYVSRSYWHRARRRNKQNTA